MLSCEPDVVVDPLAQRAFIEGRNPALFQPEPWTQVDEDTFHKWFEGYWMPSGASQPLKNFGKTLDHKRGSFA